MTIYEVAESLISLISHCCNLQHLQFFLLHFLKSHNREEMRKGANVSLTRATQKLQYHFVMIPLQM